MSFTATNMDNRGVARGKCQDCACEEYSQPITRHSCDYCGCPAAHHVALPTKPELLIKIEPEEDGGGTEVPTVSTRPRAGPSRRTSVQMRHGGVGSGLPQSLTPTPAAVAAPFRRQGTKRCKELYESNGCSYDSLVVDDKQLAIFIITYEGKVIYMGEPKKTPLKVSLRSIFNGGSIQDISKFIKRIKGSVDKMRRVKVAWLKQLKNDPHDQTCKEGKKHLSYRQCISRLQGQNPRDVLRRLLSS